MKKQSIAIFLCLSLCMTLGACKGKKETPLPKETAPPKVVTENTEPKATPTSTPVNQEDGQTMNSIRASQEEYFKRADEIEAYSKKHLDTATDQHTINQESGAVYQKWDDLLNDVYRNLKKELNKEQWAILENDEAEWIKEKEAAIEEAGKEWEGGSGEPMARNMAGIEKTRTRCYELIELLP